MSTIRPVTAASASRPTLEGAGVRIRRAFGFHQTPNLDPFLLLDEFHSDNPADYIKGFPWHPHRGIETITYMLRGRVAHGDSMGNAGVIAAGDVQWMTAGSGIIHQEMPEGDETGEMWGFQLWANLPAASKMMNPRYQEIKAEQIPAVKRADGSVVRVVCGEFEGTRGPVQDIMTDPAYLDVELPAGSVFRRELPAEHSLFLYVFHGAVYGDERRDKTLGAQTLVTYGGGDRLEVTAGAQGARMLVVSGAPLREPVAWYGPIVMNTQAELETAFKEYQQGTFLKHKR